MTGRLDEVEAHLRVALDIAVTLRVFELARLPDDARGQTVRQWAADAVEAVAHRGDALMFTTKGRKGSTAAVFNALAKGLAAGSFQPGGVTFLGRRWESRSRWFAAPSDQTDHVSTAPRAVTTVDLLAAAAELADRLQSRRMGEGE